MAVPQQADADPVAVVLAWLLAHPEIPALLGGPAHISGVAEAPWPHLVVDDGQGGDLRDFWWDAELEVSLQLLGHPNGAPGKGAMRSLMLRVLAAVAQLPDTQTVTAGVPVVSRVRPSGTYVWAPLANSQPTLLAGVYVTIRPPLVLPVV